MGGSTVLLLVLMVATVLGLAPLLCAFQSWRLADSFAFIWYTLTTIGLGDTTVNPLHPVIASVIVVMLFFIGVSAARALVCSVHNATAVLEQSISGVSHLHGTGRSVFTDALDPLTTSRAGARELNPIVPDGLVSGQEERTRQIPFSSGAQ